MITINQFKDKDTDDVITLALHFQNDGSRPSISVSDQPDLLCIAEEYIDNGGNFWVAKDSNKVVGTIGIMRYSNEIAILKKFFVYEEYQGKPVHLGQRLYQMLLDYARQQHFHTLVLDTPKNTTRAHKFYVSAGFKKIDEKELPIKYHYPIATCDFFILHF